MRLFWVMTVVGCSVVNAAPLTAQRESEVKAVWVFSSDGKLAGGTSKVVVRIAPNRSRVPSVGVMEEFAGGTGDQWRTALWQAAFVATQATSTNLLDFEFTLRVGGRIDGPSAGLLTAATLTALIRGKKVIPATTMTGTINPDGSSGPVGGILYKLRGAASDGIKRFGFPIGGRQQVDAAGETIDLLAEGQRLGVEVKELRSLDEAYLFLAGEALPRPTPTNEAAMELSPDELAALNRLTDRVRSEIQAELPELENALKRVDGKVATYWKGAINAETGEATQLAKNGDSARAMFLWSSSLTTTRLATQDARMRSALGDNDFPAVLAIIRTHETALPVEMQNLRRDIDAQFPNTSRTNDIYAMDLLESVLGEQGNLLRAKASARELTSLAKRVAEGPATDELRRAFSNESRRYVGDLLRVREELKNGQRFLALYASLPPVKKSKPGINAGPLANSYASAGSASRAYFEALITAPMAQAAGVSVTQVQGAFVEKDRSYLDLIGYAELLTSETDGRSRLLLAVRQTIFSARLVNTYYSLGGQLDAKGGLTISNPRALTSQIELANARVLQSCGRAVHDTGVIPFPARVRFLNARAAREGDDRQKTDTLAELWLANWWCDFAVAR